MASVHMVTYGLCRDPKNHVGPCDSHSAQDTEDVEQSTKVTIRKCLGNGSEKQYCLDSGVDGIKIRLAGCKKTTELGLKTSGPLMHFHLRSASTVCHCFFRLL